MSKFCQRVVVLFLFASITACGGVKSDDLPEKQRTVLGLYLTAQEAYKLAKKGGNKIMFDVRTPAEAEKGSPRFAINVPILIREKEDNRVVFNTKFVPTIKEKLKKKGLNEQSVIIMISNEGKRSARAVNTLAKKEYQKVYNVVEGFIGWKKKNLPLSD
ncbi:hypothetical protein PN36_28260 [Candidatus Thiomargarita nelsonii]|uniref:Rhodanese domain-containing protein n=1 Tax=Candidatus Thiomargarita nelsonii TaxID=1003181 RepID=A0A4E0QM36_9GAMM|nr:hypothetical protein PN36_28260 [Candidatus Thiomargarita nelsonii]